MFQQKRNDEKSQKKRDNTPEEKIFYSPNTFYVNAQNLYININETANINWEEKPPKPKTSLQNKHSLIINNLNYACEKKLNVSSNTTKHKRNFTDNLKINPDFTYLDYRQEKAKEVIFLSLFVNYKKYQIIFVFFIL